MHAFFVRIESEIEELTKYFSSATSLARQQGQNLSMDEMNKKVKDSESYQLGCKIAERLSTVRIKLIVGFE